jgi:tRNA-dihydrouridine synthase A
MFGRAAYQDPYLLATVDRDVFGEADAPTPERAAVVDTMIAYAERACARGAPIQAVVRPMIGLFRGRPGGRAWRRHLSEAAHRPGAGPEILADALARTRERAIAPAA